MLNQKSSRVIPTLVTTILAFFLVGGVVVAATTIGSSLSTDGNLTVLGNVGIGTSTPSARFSVTGDGTGATRAFVFANSSNVEKFTIFNNGNVGIGTTSPGALLAVNQAGGGFYVQSAGSVGIGTANGVFNAQLMVQASGSRKGIRIIGTDYPNTALAFVDSPLWGHMPSPSGDSLV